MRLDRILPTLAAALVMAAVGCSKSEPEEAPAACLDGPDAYLEALRSAPDEVRLEGETPISACLPPGQGGGGLAEVGSTMIEVATLLNAEALQRGRARATVRLGYLVGAAERGAEETSGIHGDLILRLNAAARFSPAGPPSPAFRRAFERGYEAGRDSG